MAIFYATFFQEQFFPTKAMEKNGTEKMLRKKMATETISWRLAASCRQGAPRPRLLAKLTAVLLGRRWLANFPGNVSCEFSKSSLLFVHGILH